MPLPDSIQGVRAHARLLELTDFMRLTDTLSTKISHTDADIRALRAPLLHLLQRLTDLPSAHTSVMSRVFNYGIGFFYQQAETSRNTIDTLSHHERAILRACVVNALEQLAYAYPINTTDPIDYEPILNGEPYFVSLTGSHYRLSNMALWIAHKKDFFYPLYSERMHLEDIERFKQQCLEEGVSYLPLSDYQIALNQKCEALGISEEILRTLRVPQLRLNHLVVIEQLINEYGCSIEDAMSELQGLNYEQADALLAYFDIGLRGEHLRQLLIDESEYGPHHTAALEHLMTKHGMDIEQAIETISPYGFDEVQELYFIVPPLARR